MALLKPVAVPAEGTPPRDHCVVAFARPPVRAAGFSLRDRIELERWSRAAAASGVSRVRLERPEPQDPATTGGFLLIYLEGGDWAHWGVAPIEDGRIELWSMVDGRSHGCFGSLGEALARVAAV